MIKKFFILLFIVYLIPVAKSQIVLSVSDLPKPGYLYTSSRIDSIEAINLSPGNSGENVAWDFGMLNFYGGSFDNSLDSVQWIYSTSTNESSYFPLANIAQNSNCYWYHDWTTHIISWRCYHDYYIKDSTGLYFYGSTYPMFRTFLYLRNIFPLIRYGDTLTNTSRQFVIGITGDTTYVTYVKDTSIADGWGTVYTPINSYEAIRIYTNETVWDSIYVNGIGQLVKFQSGNYYYKWYTKNLGFPVMQINKGILEKQSAYQIARFAVSVRNTEILDISVKNSSADVIPNPFSENAKIILKNNFLKQKCTLIIYDITAKELMREKIINSDEIIISKGNLKSGFYYYRIIGQNELFAEGKFIIRD